MLDVIVTTSNVEITEFLRLANRIQERFRFIFDPDPTSSPLKRNAEEVPIRLQITNEESDTLYSADLQNGVTVSCHSHEGICQYANISLETLILIISLLGLVQWRSLHLNPLLRPDDLLTRDRESCLFHWREFPQDYILIMDERRICAGCFDFYDCLAVEPELFALRQVLQYAAED